MRAGVAVQTADGTRYVGGDEATFTLASVVKLPIMVATLRRADVEGRSLTGTEQALLRNMIAISSNNSTDALWVALGGGTGVATLLEPLGVTDIEFAPDHQWGDSLATPLAVADLLHLLIDEDSPLSEESRAEALELMEGVAAEQAWGASAGVDLTGDGATLAIKNGWYPDVAGWFLNTAGIITVLEVDGRAAPYVVVVLTDGASTQTEGVAAIESITAAINAVLLPPALVVSTQPREFAPIDPTPVESAAPAEAGVPTEVEPDEPPTDEQREPAEEERAAVSLVSAAQASDVLVPGDGRLVGSEDTEGELKLWFELPSATASELVTSYAASMLALGWLEVNGPPSVVLSKSIEGRWVGLSTYPGSPGVRLVEVTISPAPGVVPAGFTAP